MTIRNPLVQVSGVLAELPSGDSLGDYATKTGVETLTNKTLSSATISGTTLLPGSGNLSSAGALGLGGTSAVSTMLRMSCATTAVGAQVAVLSPSQNTSNWIVAAFNCSDNTTNLNSIDWQFTSIASGTGPAIGAYRTSATATDFTLSATNSDLRLEMLRLQGGTKRVGIMTSAPNDALDVNGNVVPHTDNTYSMGTATWRWSTIFAATGTINTSGEETKESIREFSEAETAVAKALAANSRVYQFCDAVAKKGVDVARLHVGMIYEDVVAAFAAQGLDPLRYGIVCRDPVMKVVMTTTTVIKSIARDRYQSVTVPVERISIVDGKAVLTVVDTTVQQQVFNEYPMVNPDGTPVLDADGQQVIYREPATDTANEDFEETVETQVQDTDENGNPKWIVGLRYAELAQFMIAGLAARVGVLEAR